jgi:hypothetical protein
MKEMRNTRARTRSGNAQCRVQHGRLFEIVKPDSGRGSEHHRPRLDRVGEHKLGLAFGSTPAYGRVRAL